MCFYGLFSIAIFVFIINFIKLNGLTKKKHPNKLCIDKVRVKRSRVGDPTPEGGGTTPEGS